MKRLRQIVSSVLMPVVLAGAIVASPKKAHAEEVKKPSIELKLEDVFNGSDKFYNDKFRLTLDNKYINFRIDKNDAPEAAVKQSQLALDLKLVQNKKTTFVLGYAGNITEAGKNGDYGISGLLIQSLGELPVIGKSSLKLFELNSFKPNDKAMYRGIVQLLSEKIDLAYDLTRGRDENLASKYFIAFHNHDFYASLGKSGLKQLQAVFTNLNNEDLGIFMIGNYNLESKVLNATFFNSYGGADTELAYAIGIGRLATNIFNMPGIEIKKPLLTDYLTFGSKITHRIDLHTEPGKWNLANQLGFAINNQIGVGAGLDISHTSKNTVKVAPIISAYFKPKIFGQDVYFEFSVKDGKISSYSYTEFKF